MGLVATPSRAYADGTHIRPLGCPHNGPGVTERALWLCPNDYVCADTAEVWLDDEPFVMHAGFDDRAASLVQVGARALSCDGVQQHRDMWRSR